MSTHITRRRLLQTAFCSSVALSLNLKPGVFAAESADDIHLLMIGDFGSQKSSQTAVASAMKKYVTSNSLKPEWLILLGDNFYDKMEGGLKSKRWQTGFEEMYPASHFPGPCPAILGNHDYHDNLGGEKVQMAYAAQGNTRWCMPHNFYRKDLGDLATFLFIDTNLPSISGTPYPKEPKKNKPSITRELERNQWDWLKQELKSSRGKFTFVAGHHPVYSNGAHGDSKSLVSDLAPMLQEYGVHLYLCGHDHDLQHLELKDQKTSFVLSGGGGARVRELKNIERKMPYGNPVYGFSHIQINQQRVIVRHIDANGQQLHAFEKSPDFSWKVS